MLLSAHHERWVLCWRTCRFLLELDRGESCLYFHYHSKCNNKTQLQTTHSKKKTKHAHTHTLCNYSDLVWLFCWHLIKYFHSRKSCVIANDNLCTLTFTCGLDWDAVGSLLPLAAKIYTPHFIFSAISLFRARIRQPILRSIACVRCKTNWNLIEITRCCQQLHLYHTSLRLTSSILRRAACALPIAHVKSIVCAIYSKLNQARKRLCAGKLWFPDG